MTENGTTELRVMELLRDAGVGQIVRTDDHGGWDVRDVPAEVIAEIVRLLDEMRARVEAAIEEEVQAAYFNIAVEKMLTVQTVAPGRAAVPPHWREAAEFAASVPVADLRTALGTRPIPPGEGDAR